MGNRHRDHRRPLHRIDPPFYLEPFRLCHLGQRYRPFYLRSFRYPATGDARDIRLYASLGASFRICDSDRKYARVAPAHHLPYAAPLYARIIEGPFSQKHLRLDRVREHLANASYLLVHFEHLFALFQEEARMKKWLSFLALLSGCMVGPNYHAPNSCVSDTWNAESEESNKELVQKWWEGFDDDLLTKYIHLAGSQNYEIQTAEANILKARALRQIAASQLFPQVVADLNGTKTYFSKNGPVFAIGQAVGNPGVTTSPTTGSLSRFKSLRSKISSTLYSTLLGSSTFLARHGAKSSRQQLNMRA